MSIVGSHLIINIITAQVNHIIAIESSLFFIHPSYPGEINAQPFFHNYNSQPFHKVMTVVYTTFMFFRSVYVYVRMHVTGLQLWLHIGVTWGALKILMTASQHRLLFN